MNDKNALYILVGCIVRQYNNIDILSQFNVL